MSETRLKFNVHTGEFDCAGSEKFIQTSRDEFKRLILDMEKARAKTAPATKKEDRADPLFGSFPELSRQLDDAAKKAEKAAPAIPAEYKDVFTVSGDSGISIHTLPTESEGDYAKLADAMLILLWAFHKFLGQDTVSSLDVGTCLRKSGAAAMGNFSRAVSIVQKNLMITKSGAKRGTRYGLTTRGSKRASEIVEALVAKTK